MGYRKDPDAVLDYTWDWSDWLPSGDTITAVSAVATTGITVANQTNTTTGHTIWLSGGTEGNEYTVTSRVTTAGGRTDDRSIKVRVEQR